MKILIEFKYDIVRQEVLDTKEYDESDKEGKVYTSNCFTEKYLTCGAPKRWNQLRIAEIFRNYVKSNELERFEFSHVF